MAQSSRNKRKAGQGNLLQYLGARECGIPKRSRHADHETDTAKLLAEEKATLPIRNQSCELSGQSRATFLTSFSPDGTKIASTHGDHKVRVTDIKTGQCTHILAGHPRTPWCLVFHPTCDAILASGCLGGEVRIWDLHGGGSEVWKSDKNAVIASISFHPTDQVLVIASGNELIFWDWSRPTPFARCKTANDYEKVRWVKFDPWGHYLYTGIANPCTTGRDMDSVSYISGIADDTGENQSFEEQRFLNDRYRHLVSQISSHQRERINAYYPPHVSIAGGSTSTTVSSSQPMVSTSQVAGMTFSGPHHVDIDIVEPSSPVHFEALEDARQYAQQVTNNTNAALSNARQYAAHMTSAAMLRNRHEDVEREVVRVRNEHANDPDAPLAPALPLQSDLSTGAEAGPPPVPPPSGRELPLTANTRLTEALTVDVTAANSSTDSQLAVNYPWSSTTPPVGLVAVSGPPDRRESDHSVASGESPTTQPSEPRPSESRPSESRPSILSSSLRPSTSTAEPKPSTSGGSGSILLSRLRNNSEGDSSATTSSGCPLVTVLPSSYTTGRSQVPTVTVVSASSAAASSVNTTTSSSAQPRMSLLRTRLMELNSPPATTSLASRLSSAASSSSGTPSVVASQSSSSSSSRTRGFHTDRASRLTTTVLPSRSSQSRVVVQRRSHPSSFLQRSFSDNIPDRPFPTNTNRDASGPALNRTQSNLETTRPDLLLSSSEGTSRQADSQRLASVIGNQVRQTLERVRSRQIDIEQTLDTLNQLGEGTSRSTASSSSRGSSGSSSVRSTGPPVSGLLSTLLPAPTVSSTATSSSTSTIAASSTSSAASASTSGFRFGQPGPTAAGSSGTSVSSLSAEIDRRLMGLNQLGRTVSELTAQMGERLRAASEDRHAHMHRHRSHRNSRHSRAMERMRNRQERLRQRFEELRRLRQSEVPRVISEHSASTSVSEESNALADAGQELRAVEAEVSQARASAQERVTQARQRHQQLRQEIENMHSDLRQRIQAQRPGDRTWHALQRRHLHPHYSVSILDDTVNRQNDGLQAAINRAIAGAFMGVGEPAIASNIVNVTHRIQRWDFTKCQIPDITQSESNIVVDPCKVHNDASCDISQDGRFLSTFVPSHQGFPDDTILGVFSLEPNSLGDCLYTKSFGPNAISVSLSPLNNYVLVGLAAKRLAWVFTPKQMVAQVYKMSNARAGEDSMEHICDLMHPCDLDIRSNISVNSARWLPGVGEGVVYGTNRGDLHICRPGDDEQDSKDRRGSNEHHPESTTIRRNLMQMLGIDMPSTASIATQTIHRLRRTASTQTDRSDE